MDWPGVEVNKETRVFFFLFPFLFNSSQLTRFVQHPRQWNQIMENSVEIQLLFLPGRDSSGCREMLVITSSLIPQRVPLLSTHLSHLHPIPLQILSPPRK